MARSWIYDRGSTVPGGGGGSGVAQGPTKAVQYHAGSGVFAGDAGLVFDQPLQLLTANNITATGRILANGSFSLAAQTTAPPTASSGFAKWYFDGTQILVSYNTGAYSPIGGGGGGGLQTPWLTDIDAAGHALNGVSTLSVATALYVASGADLYGLTPTQMFWYASSNPRWILARAGAESSGDAGSDLYLYRYADAGAYLGTALVITRASGFMGLNIPNPTAQLHVKSASGVPAIVADTGFVSSDGGFYSNSAAGNALQLANGGAKMLLGMQTDQAVYLLNHGPTPSGLNTPLANYGAIAYQGGSIYWYWNAVTAGWGTFDFAGGRPGGLDTCVQFSGPQGTGGTFTGNSAFTYDTANQLVTTVNLTAHGHILVDGFYWLGTLGTAPAISPAGYAKWYFDGGVIKISIPATNSGNWFTWGFPGGTNEDIQFKQPDGSFGGTDNYIWDNPAQCVTITGKTSTHGLIVKTSDIQSDQGFYSPSTLGNAVNIPSGGSTCYWQTAVNSFIALGTVPPYPGPVLNQGKLYFDAITKRWMMTEDTTGPFFLRTAGVAGSDKQVQFNDGGFAFGGDPGLLYDKSIQLLTATNIQVSNQIVTWGWYALKALGSTAVSSAGFTKFYFDGTTIKISLNGNPYITWGLPGGANQNVQFKDVDGSSQGSGNFIWDKAAQCVTIQGLTGTQGLIVRTAYIQADQGFFSSSAADTAINVQSGGSYCYRHISINSIVALGTVSPYPAPVAGQGKLYFDVITKRWMATEDIGAAFFLRQGNVAGADKQIQFNDGGFTFGGDTNFIYDKGLRRMTVSGVSNTPGISVTGSAFVQAEGGFYCSLATGYNSIQSVGGIISTQRVSVYPTLTPDLGAGLGLLGHFVGLGTSSIPAVAVAIDAYDTGATPTTIAALVGRRAVGSPGGALGNLGNGVTLFAFGARGSTTSGFTSSSTANMQFLTSENWSPAANGTEIIFATTQNLGTTRTNKLWVRNDGLIEALGRTGGLAGMLLTNGFYQSSDSGFYAAGAFVSVFNAPNGGASLGKAVYLGLQSSAPTAPLTNYGGLGWAGGSSYWYWNGSSFALANLASIGSGGGGITSINTLTGPAITISGGTGISISSGGSTISISLNSAASVTFGSVTSGLFNATTVAGGSIAFQIQNSLGNPFQVNGNGAMSCQQVNVNAWQVVDSNQNIWWRGNKTIENNVFVGGSVQCNGGAGSHIYGYDFGIINNGGNFTGANFNASAPFTISTSAGSLTVRLIGGILCT